MTMVNVDTIAAYSSGPSRLAWFKVDGRRALFSSVFTQETGWTLAV